MSRSAGGAPQPAGAGGAEHLVAGEGVEVAAHRRHVHRAVRQRLRAVHAAVTIPRLRASRQIAATGFTVPSTFETWVTASSFTSAFIFAYRSSGGELAGGRDADHLDRGAGALGHQLQGTMLAWCSISVTRIVSPALSRDMAQL